jgi:hypothetical protein
MAIALPLAGMTQILSNAEDIFLDPIKNTIYYFVPFFGAMNSKYTPINANDSSQRHLISDTTRDTILHEIEVLRQNAHLRRQIRTFTALNVNPTSYGGLLSLTQPVLVVPYEYLFRPDGTHFGSEKDDENLADKTHIFSDDETRFLIAREIGHLKYNDAFFKTAAKIVLIAAAVLLCMTPLGWIGTAILVAGAFTVFVIADRIYEGKIDLFAAQIVGTAIKDDRRALLAALNALKKLRAQNLEKRKNNFLSRLFITSEGNNLLDFKHPLLTSRIRTMQKMLELNQSRSLIQK